MCSCKALFTAALLASSAHAVPVGTFTDVSDVGAVSRPTEAAYDDATSTYTVGASGDNMRGARDAFGFVFRRGAGSAKPLQLTRDRYSNWTPRLSPAGNEIAFISGVMPARDGKPEAGDYLLRELSIDVQEAPESPRELARFYGGPASLGPAPWAADGKQLVFLSREPD